MEDIRLFFKIFGMIIRVFSVFHILASIASIIIGGILSNPIEFKIAFIFLVTGTVLYLIGFLLEKSIKIPLESVKRKRYVVISALAIAWLILPLIGGIVYYFNGLSFIDSYFESMSAWTTTGFTMYKNLNTLPYSVRFWRSFEQWVGGIGIIAFIVYLFRDNRLLYHIVKFEGREEFIEATINHSIKTVFRIYAILTFVGAALLSFSGMNAFTAINLSMTALATGGMTPITYLNLNALQKVILIFLMIFGASNFLFHYKVFFQGNFKFLKIYEPLRWMLFFILLVSVLGYFSNNITLLDSIFHTVSAITCTGFSYLNLKSLNEGYLFGLILLMIIGGAVGSTAGGVKIDRIILLLKGVRRYIKNVLSTSKEVVLETYMNREIREEDISNAGLYFFLYMFILMISAILLTLYTKNFIYSMFEIASAMGNVGLSVGFISPHMPLAYKLLLIFLMWGGRIEFLITAAFIYGIFRKWGT